MTDVLAVDLRAVITEQMVQRMTQAEQVLLQAEQSVFTGQRSGRIYHRHGRTHQASALGEPPAEDTGALRGSWQPIPPTITSDGDTITITGGIRTEGVPYAFRFDPSLEPYLGGVAPRPFVAPILDLAQPEIERIFSAPFALGDA